MGAVAAIHPDDPILQAYGLGKLDDISSESVSKHLEGCDPCKRRVAELSSDEFWRTAGRRHAGQEQGVQLVAVTFGSSSTISYAQISRLPPVDPA